MSDLQQKSFDELGSSGLKRSGGVITEEFLRDLTGERARKIYREMADNDPIVGAILYAIDSLIRQVEWRVECEDEEPKEFIEGCLEDMSHTWEDFISEVLSMLIYGFSWHETVLKTRSGESKDPKKNSRFNDGKIGWRKLPIRAQDSLFEWKFDDEDGGVRAFVQMAPPDFKIVEIPIERSLLFRVGVAKGNPEGRSLLRRAYRSWFFKRRIEEIEAIGIERDLAGMPCFYRDATMASQHDTELKKILRNIRRDEQEGLLLPLAYDESGRKLLEFSLVSSSGSRQINVTDVINRYNKVIATTCLADFLLLGQQAVGSFALASTKTELFSVALGSLLKSIASVMNRIAIPRLFAVNAWKLEKLPKLVPGDVEAPNLQELGQWITALSGAGVALFPDDELENHLRRLSNLPAKPEGKLPQAPPMPKPKGPSEKSGTEEE